MLCPDLRPPFKKYTMITLWRALDYIQSWVNQRGGTLMLSEETMIQYINMAALNIYFFEWRQWPWMRQKETIALWAQTTPGEIHTFQATKIIVAVQNIDDLSVSGCYTGAWTPKGSDADMALGDFYLPGLSEDITFALFPSTKSIALTYFAYNLFTEQSIPTMNETIIIPEAYLPALYHFTLACVYPQYIQYGENRETTAYQMGVNYLMNIAKSQTTTLNTIRSK